MSLCAFCGWRRPSPPTVWLLGPQRREGSKHWEYAFRQSWCYQRQYDAAIRSLSRMHILATISSVIPKLMLNQHFKGSLRAALTGGGAQMSFGIPASKDKEKEKEGDKRTAMTVEQLDWHAVERWEVRFSSYYTFPGSQSPSHRLYCCIWWLQGQEALPRGLLTACCFCYSEAGWWVTRRKYSPWRTTKFEVLIRNGQQITSKGFQFLLYTPHEQLWDLLLQYLHMAEVLGWHDTHSSDDWPLTRRNVKWI